ncbi:MAG: hypothetical protein H6813_04605 [Phycisphaeraceae bacterium]|nr:hypothetical protein [Phycisphaeraceae bacterium]MCB9847230.1 hypothetical protein [Phycisphaeraceae bacterium]
MERIHRASRQARRRRLIADGVNRLGVALTLAIATGLLAIVISRLIGEPLDWRWAAVPTIAIGVLAALLGAWRLRLTELEAATDVDTALGLRDRLGSSIELESLDRSDPFVLLLERDADEAAGKADIAQATPIRFGESWLAWPGLAALLILAVLFMPTLDLLGRQKAAQTKAQEQAQLEEAADRIESLIKDSEEAIAQLDPTPEDENNLSDIINEGNEQLNDIMEQLRRNELTPEEADALVDAILDEQAQQLQEQADLAQQQSDKLGEMLAESADPDNTDASPLEQALNAGDFDSAMSELQKLRSELESMSEEQRQELSDSMNKLAERLSESAKNNQAQNDAAQKMAEQLQQMGLSKEMAEQLAQNGDAQQIARQLQQQGLDPATAQQLAQQLAQQKQQGESREGASRSAEKLAEALKQASQGAGKGDPKDMQALGEALEGLSDEELQGQLAQLAADQSAQQTMGGMRGNGLGGGSQAGEGTNPSERIPSTLGKSFNKDIHAEEGGGEGEVAMRYTTKRPIEWDETASNAPMRQAQIREAAQAAEQAIEEQTISPRYRGAIREYFERWQRVAPPAADEPAPAPASEPQPADPNAK